jgi:hypothetical protein
LGLADTRPEKCIVADSGQNPGLVGELSAVVESIIMYLNDYLNDRYFCTMEVLGLKRYPQLQCRKVEGLLGIQTAFTDHQ